MGALVLLEVAQCGIRGGEKGVRSPINPAFEALYGSEKDRMRGKEAMFKHLGCERTLIIRRERDAQQPGQKPSNQRAFV